MALKYKTRAFVFKKSDMGESDRFFSVFTEEFGRLEIFGKAIRKTASKLRSGIDIFFMSEIEFIQGKTRKTLTDAVATEKFNNVWQDLEKFKTANRIGEVLDNFIKGEQKDENVFNLLNETFTTLDKFQVPSSKFQALYYYFLWSLLSLLGYHPQVEKCNICQQKLNPYAIYFSDKIGGTICKKCLGHDASATKINSDIVKIFRLIFKKDWQMLSKLKIEVSSQKLFENVSENYYAYILSGHSSKNNYHH
ncbi:MAG: DNA repair protein RecO [Candidatus Staskawiczbacteria bacterium]|nr:DNA repair protein RecO [Candidatus Staskawiczbacteria bacterium]